MAVLSDREPKKVLYYFEQLCAIPHPSFHTQAMSNYLVSFAKERGLRCRQEAFGNVIIWKDAAAGYENAPTVMLQGHMDMVAEAEADCHKDMTKEGLELFVDGDLLGARGTTLGGDDGIAVAMALAILDADDIPHGPLECVFTVNEEVDMLGARTLDVSDLKAKYMINIDSEKEKILTVSCAGGVSVVSTLPVARETFDGTLCKVTVGGLAGGHSGEEIQNGRASANIVMGRALYHMANATKLRLVRADGGTKENAIPREATAIVCVKDAVIVKALAEKLTAVLKNEYSAGDGGIFVAVEDAEDTLLPMTHEDTNRIITMLHCSPCGVQEMSVEMPGLVQTSVNLGILRTENDAVVFTYLPRSSINSQRDAVASRIELLTHMFGGTVEMISSYSAWQYRADSPLRDKMVEIFRTRYGEEPCIAATHGGLECGVLSGKMPSLDCISIGPDITDIHTPRERLHLASTLRTWNFVLEALRQLKD